MCAKNPILVISDFDNLSLKRVQDVGSCHGFNRA